MQIIVTTVDESADAFYDLYTYGYHMVEGGTDDGFSAVAYAYAKEVKAFEDLGYGTGKVE